MESGGRTPRSRRAGLRIALLIGLLLMATGLALWAPLAQCPECWNGYHEVRVESVWGTPNPVVHDILRSTCDACSGRARVSLYRRWRLALRLESLRR